VDEAASLPAAEPATDTGRAAEREEQIVVRRTPQAAGSIVPSDRRIGQRPSRPDRAHRPARSPLPPSGSHPSPLSARLTDLLRPLTVATANAVRRSRVELTVYQASGGIEATTGFGLTDDEREVVSRLVAAWGRELRRRGPVALRSEGNVPIGTRPPAPTIERATDPAWSSELQAALVGIKRGAALLIPLIIDGEIVGRLSAWSPGDSRPLAQPAILAVTALAEQAGLTIRDARRLTIVERRVAEQAALLRVGQAVPSDAELPEALAALARAGLGVSGAEGCSIELLLTGAHECVVAADEAAAGWEIAAATGGRYPLALAPALAGALRTGLPWALASDDPALGPSLSARLRTRQASRALLLPVALGDQTFGGAILTWRGRRGRPSVEGELGRDYANQIALVLDRLRLATALRLRAAFDAVTGLPNRPAMMAEIGAEIARTARRGGRLAIAVVRAGDSAGDDATGTAAFARQLASLFQHTLRASDRVGMIGGGEYVLLLPDTDAHRARRVADRLEERAGEIAELSGCRLRFGIAAFPDDGATAEDLLVQATARGTPQSDGGPAAQGRIEPSAVPFQEIEAALIGGVA
jgi:diguanylate cyclase (GGDEF)-like protein